MPTRPADVPRQPPNPNPFNYRIFDSFTTGDVLVVNVRYPDCVNFEGDKIMVYRGVTMDALNSQGLKVGLDPHFSSSHEYASPIARFVPTGEGWQMAVRFARSLVAGLNK